MAPRRPSAALAAVGLAIVVGLAAATTAFAQKTVAEVVMAVPDCQPFVSALKQYRPDVFTAISQPGFQGTDGEEYVTLLPNARVYASRRGGGPIVHLIGGEAPWSLAPLPVANTASILGLESPRGGANGDKKGVVALIDIVLQPPESAMPAPGTPPTPGATALLPAPAASGDGAAATTAALQQARVLATTPAPALGNSTANTNANGTDVRVGAAGGPSIIPKKLKKQIVKVVRKLLP